MDHIVERIEKFAGGDKRHKGRDKIEGENRKVYIIIKITPERSVIFCIPTTIILKLYNFVQAPKRLEDRYSNLCKILNSISARLSQNSWIFYHPEREIFPGEIKHNIKSPKYSLGGRES